MRCKRFISLILAITIFATVLCTAGCNGPLKETPSTAPSASDTTVSKSDTDITDDVQSNLDRDDLSIPATSETDAREPSTLKKGDNNDAVKKLQVRLKKLGYLSDNADGDFGNNTENAVKVFQTAAGIESTGIADTATLEAIYSENAHTAPTTYDHEDVLDATHKKDYYIIVYADNCKVLVLGKDEYGKYNQVVKCFTCSVGREGKETPTGVFKISKRYDWRAMFGNVYAQYVTKFYGNYLFHSVPYYTESPDDLEMEEFEKLGSPASKGCVRLCTRDAKWLYDNAVNGTQVRVLSGKECDVEAEPIPSLNYEGEYNGWDPTDPNPKSPYNN